MNTDYYIHSGLYSGDKLLYYLPEVNMITLCTHFPKGEPLSHSLSIGGVEGERCIDREKEGEGRRGYVSTVWPCMINTHQVTIINLP